MKVPVRTAWNQTEAQLTHTELLLMMCTTNPTPANAPS